MNWLKKTIKNALRELIKEDSIVLAKKSVEHVVLDDYHVNVLAIDCGQIPRSKATELLNDLASNLKKENPKLKLVLIQK